MKKFFKFLLLFILLIILIVLIISGIYLYKLNSELPSIGELKNYKYKTPTIIYDTDKNIIAELGNELRYPVTFEKIPKDLVNALVAVEDSRFYEHEGIDFISIIRAFFANIKAGKIVEGGSTLTQQLVKVIYLTPEKKLKRKVKEAILAYKLDSYLPKQKILELYLNQVYFGRGAYGVQAAAKNYFGKNVWELNLEECALIASLPKAPSYYAPHIDYERAITRRNYSLLRMYEEGYISENEYKKVIDKPITFLKTKPQRIKMAEYFVDYITKNLQKDLKIDDIKNSGMQIYTTLNSKFQFTAEKSNRINLFNVSKRQGYFGPVANIDDNEYLEKLKRFTYLKAYGVVFAEVTKVSRNFVDIDINGVKGILDIRDHSWARPFRGDLSKLEDFRVILKSGDIVLVYSESNNKYFLYQEPLIEGALLAINPHNGSIIAMVGGFDFNKSMFNRATMAARQVGSLFKPIVYSAAIDMGYDVTYQVFDAPVIKKSTIDEYWKPSNFEEKFYGFTTLKEGLAKSRNIVTIKLASEIGVSNILHYAKAFGIKSPMNRDLSISIGSGSATLEEMVYAFSAFPNSGKIQKIRYVKYILDNNNKKIYEDKPTVMYSPIKESTAHIMVDALINVVENGTGRKAKHIPRFIGGKTGSTNDYRDAWFVGFLPNIVIGSWVGFDDYTSIGRLETGARVALPAWIDFLESIINEVDYSVYPVSENVVYYKVDKNTYKRTNAVNVPYLFEPFAIDKENRSSEN
jgi:penicillin-binding protein 1A